jgi:aldose 1-epimerase
MNEQAISETAFGVTRSGRAVSLFTLRNCDGLTAQISNYGGTVTSLQVPDPFGKFSNVVLGYDSLAQYEAGSSYFGALIGRYGNRIAGGRFDLDGQEYLLAANNPPNHLHGGKRGFDSVVWEAAAEQSEQGPRLILGYVSEDGEQGYPGKLAVEVVYTLTHKNELRIDYQAGSDRVTPVNFTHHSYFNLTGDPARDVLGHVLEINADHYTPVDHDLIPTGAITPVAGTPFDFRKATTVGARIDDEHEQLAIGGGYDHNFVLKGSRTPDALFAARVSDPLSGRIMEVHTSEPGMQLYSANALEGAGRRTGLCLETQHFPDSPNQPEFPSTILQPGQTYKSQTVYAFAVKEMESQSGE